MVKTPPYEVKESGYGGFDVYIVVHFRNKYDKDQSQISFKYELDLPMQGNPPVNNIRVEKISFYCSNDLEFTQNVLKSGGVSYFSIIFYLDNYLLLNIFENNIFVSEQIKKHEDLTEVWFCSIIFTTVYTGSIFGVLSYP